MLFLQHLLVRSFICSSLCQADVIERLRLQYKKDLLKVVDIVLSHQVLTHHSQLGCPFLFKLPRTLSWIVLCAFVCLQGVRRKNKLILQLMEQLVYPNPAAYRDILIRFSALNHTNYSEVGLCIELLKHEQKTFKIIFSVLNNFKL